MTSTLHIQLLGEFRLLYDMAPEARVPVAGAPQAGVPVTGVDSPRLQLLLAYLVLHRDAPQARSHLAFTFWLDSTEVQARSNLRKQVYHLRRALPDADRFLYADTKVLQWRSDAPFTLDVAAFEEALAQAEEAERSGSQVALRASLERAVSRYQGDLLPSCYDDWVLVERERLRQRFVGALEALISLLEGQREYEAAIKHGQRLLRHDPLHEATYGRLMRLHALRGDRARALRTYHTCATVLQRELDVEPSAATREAYERLMKLDAEPVSVPDRLISASPLVGRDAEWAQLQRAWLAASRDRPRLALVSGEAGIGKTRLAEELVDWANRQGIPAASARCYASEGGLAYAPVTAWLRADALQATLSSLDEIWLSEVARLLPELLIERPNIPPPGPFTEAWQRHRLFEALARAFQARRQLLLLLDDVQSCDGETLEWLPTLLRADADATSRGERPVRLLVVATMRTEEMPGDGRLAALLGDLRRSGQLAEIELGPLDEAQTMSLARHVAGRELDPALTVPLYQGSEGNPLFVVEMVRAGQAKSETWIAAHGQEQARVIHSLPPKVRRVIEARLAQLSPGAHDLVGLAATIGREFTFDVLYSAHGADEEMLVRALDELWQRRIVREQGAEAYDFSHDRIREVAYADLSTARRRLLHRRVAEALEAAQEGDLDSMSSQVAAHYEQAGRPEEAIPHYQRAAGAARAIYANDKAISHLRRAIALLPGAARDDVRAAQLYEQLGEVLAMLGEHEKARQAFELAVSRAPGTESLWRSRLQGELANTWRSQQRYEDAGSAYDAAIQELGSEPATHDPAWWQVWLDIQLARADMLYFASSLPEMAELCREMEAVVAVYGTARQQSNYYHALVMLSNRQSRFRPGAETIEHISRALKLARETDDRQLIDHKTFGLGFSMLWYGDLEAAGEYLADALSRSEQTGNVPLQDRCLAYLSIACRLRGDLGQTRVYVERGLAVATAEHNPLYLGTANANLSWLSYRARKPDEAVRYGRAALKRWRSVAYPFEWLARWPLLALELSQGQVAEAIDQARAMLDPAQQHLPDSLTGCLEEAIRAWDEGRQESAQEHLVRGIELAGQEGYL